MGNVVELILIAEDLPTPPGVALRLLELYSQPNVEVNDMAMIIGTDPALTAKLIEYCNSPLLARDRETTNVKQAIVVLGMRAVKILALSFSLVQTTPSGKADFDYDEFWNQSLATAVVAKTLGSVGGGDGDQEFLIGLMLRIGQVGLAHTFPSRYADLMQQSCQTGVPITQLEEQEWNSHHIEVSAELLRHWHFPESIIESVTDFGQNLKNDQEFSRHETRVLKLAEQVVSILFTEELPEEEVEKAKTMAQQWFGIEPDQFGEFFDRANENWTAFADLLSFDASHAQTFEQLERRARKGIAQLSMGIHADNTAIHQQNKELKINATVDSLTNLKNRRAYQDEAPAEWERSMRKERPFVLMMVDVDHFKSVNDTHGHAVGDLTLQAIAGELINNARQYDSVYRFGGEEFVIMLPECEAEYAIAAADRFRKAIEALKIPIDGGILKVTASFGVAVQSDLHEGSLESLLEQADKLLYQAKKEGR